VSIRPVSVGEKVGKLWVINEGLNTSDQIVVEGIEKLKDGKRTSNPS
jgi:membrane fusion protein (multidrug efflux system)